MKSCHPADISRYALGIWGANEELFERIESEVRSKAKDAYMWAMPPISWPLSLDTRIEGLVGALEPVLPRRTKKNKRKAKRKMLKMPWRRGGEDG